jgi:hypothetical protein
MDEKIDMGRVVQRGFETLARNLPAYLLIAALLTGLPSFILQVVALEDAANTVGGAASWAVYLVGWLVSVLGGYLLQGAIVRSSLRDLGGMPAEIGRSLLISLRLVLPLLLLSIVVSVLTGIGFLLLIVPGIMVFVAFSVAVPVLVEERPGVFGSMQRSRDLTRGSRWRIFILCVIFYVLYFLLAALFSAIINALSDSLYLDAFLQGLLATVTAVIAAGMLTSLYLELRTVKEGATVSDLAEVFA